MHELWVAFSPPITIRSYLCSKFVSPISVAICIAPILNESYTISAYRIDPENCSFSDVDRVLKVLDDYALQKMAILHDEPTLPQAVMI